MSNKIDHETFEKFEFIKSYYEQYYVCDDLLAKLDDDEKHVLYELCKNDNLMINKKISGDCYLFVGNYYRINKKNESWKEYYLLAIEKGNDVAMYNLGNHYCDIEQNYELSKKYYLMAVEKDNAYAMNNLGYYYKTQEQNYELAKKYYLMAVKKGNVSAMHNLGYYYEMNEKNDKLSKKYYLMAFLNGVCYSFARLYFNFVQLFEKLGKMMKSTKFKNQKLKQISTKFNYALGGPKYLDAKKHFESLI